MRVLGKDQKCEKGRVFGPFHSGHILSANTPIAMELKVSNVWMWTHTIEQLANDSEDVLCRMH